MERQVRLGTFIVTFGTSMVGVGQAYAGTSVPAPAPKSSDAGTDIAPSGGIVWAFVGGLVIGLVVGYVIGKNSAQKGAAR